MHQVMVIVLNFNKREMVLECLQSLVRQTYQPCNVVVFDNASTDGSQIAIKERYPKIDLVCSSKNLGAIGGRNAAVEYARQKYEFEYLLFLDDDAETNENSIKNLVEALNNDEKTAIACGKTYINRGSTVIMSAGITVKLYFGRCKDRGAGREDEGQFDESKYVDACGAFAFLIRAKVFEQLGGFDQVFSPYGWEDIDLCLRAGKCGYQTRYVPAAIFFHKGTRLGRKPIATYEKNKARNFFTLLNRHTNWLEKLSAVIFVPIVGLSLIAKFAANGEWHAIGAQLRGTMEFFHKKNGGRN